MGRNDFNRSAAEKQLDELKEWLECLQQVSDEGVTVVVEGDKDVMALRKLGFNGIIECCSQTFLQLFCEKLARRNPGNRIVILTDWDRKGEYLADKLYKYLNGEGMTADIELRGRIRAIARRDIKDVEGLPALFSRLELLSRDRDIIK